MSEVDSVIVSEDPPVRPQSDRAWLQELQDSFDSLHRKWADLEELVRLHGTLIAGLEANDKRIEEFALPVMRDVHQGIQDSIVDLKNRMMELEMRGKAKRRQGGGKGKRGLPAKPAASRSPARQVVRQGARGAPGGKRGRR